jgi:phosphoglycolate phosphatase-like HAD superfamily hydrolase
MRYVSAKAVVLELEHFNLAGYFIHVVTALDVPKPKPSPAALLEAATALNVDVSHCIIVGDSISDVRAGHAAGAKTVAVLSGLFSRDELSSEKPDLILSDITMLPSRVDFLK